MKQRSITTIDTKTVESIFEDIDTVRRSIEVLRKKVLKLLPSRYGSDAWWEKEIGEADAEIKAGRIRELHSVHDLDRPFDKLFS